MGNRAGYGNMAFPVGQSMGTDYNVMGGYGVGNQNQAQLPQIKVGGGDDKGGWFDGFNMSQNSMIGNKDSMGWLTGGLGAVGNLASIWQGNKQLGIAQNNLEQQKAFANRGLANQAAAYNATAKNRAQSKYNLAADKAQYVKDYGTVAQQMDKYGMDGSAIG